MSHEIKIETKFNPASGVIVSEMTNVHGEIMRQVLATKEEQARKALIALGWTPPVDAAKSGLGIFRCVARTELAEKVPGLPDEVFLYLNHAITEAYKLGAASAREAGAV